MLAAAACAVGLSGGGGEGGEEGVGEGGGEEGGEVGHESGEAAMGVRVEGEEGQASACWCGVMLTVAWELAVARDSAPGS